MEQFERYVVAANTELQKQLDAGEAVADLFAKYANEKAGLVDAASDRFWVVREILNRCAQLMAAPFLRASGWKLGTDGLYVRGGCR